MRFSELGAIVANVIIILSLVSNILTIIVVVKTNKARNKLYDAFCELAQVVVKNEHDITRISCTVEDNNDKLRIANSAIGRLMEEK